MPKQNTISTNFTTGEVSPLVRGRVDSQKYQNGLETCENFIVRPQGAAWRRSGTVNKHGAHYHSRTSKLYPFEYSDTGGYLIEFSHYNARVLSSGIPLLDTTYLHSTVSALSDSSGSFQVTFTNEGGFTLSSAVNNGFGEVRCTTTIPHNLVSGDRVWFPGLAGSSYLVTYISPTVVDLAGSVYAGPYAGPFLSWGEEHCIRFGEQRSRSHKNHYLREAQARNWGQDLHGTLRSGWWSRFLCHGWYLRLGCHCNFRHCFRSARQHLHCGKRRCG
jgi:hypothetical protein